MIGYKLNFNTNNFKRYKCKTNPSISSSEKTYLTKFSKRTDKDSFHYSKRKCRRLTIQLLYSKASMKSLFIIVTLTTLFIKKDSFFICLEYKM